MADTEQPPQGQPAAAAGGQPVASAGYEGESEEARKHDAELAQFGYQQELKRGLNLLQLTAYGLNYMVPLGPVIIFGVMLVTSGGTVALPYLIAGVLCFFTALSYGVMVQKYPLAGSLFNYVSRGWNPHVGFIAGWILILDYIMIPSLVALFLTIQTDAYNTGIPYTVWLFIFVGVMGAVNLLGVDIMARLGLGLLIIGEFVMFVGFGMWIWGAHHHHLPIFTTMPLQFSGVSALMTTASIAVLLYLGYDAVTTLAEESENPQRDIPRAVYLSVIISGITLFITGYLGMLLTPDWAKLTTGPDSSTWINLFLQEMGKRANDTWFPVFYNVGIYISFSVFVIVATSAGSRLLYAMGRDNLLPRFIFGKVNKRFQTPHWGIITIIIVELLIGSFGNITRISTLVNYGALGGFAALNFSCIWLAYVRGDAVNGYRLGNKPFDSPSGRPNTMIGHLRWLVFPLIGFGVTVWVWTSMDKWTLVFGSSWMAIGIIYELILTRGWRKPPPALDL
jgi:putrescine importer